jgi:hypothetical protein
MFAKWFFRFFSPPADDKQFTIRPNQLRNQGAERKNQIFIDFPSFARLEFREHLRIRFWVFIYLFVRSLYMENSIFRTK